MRLPTSLKALKAGQTLLCWLSLSLLLVLSSCQYLEDILSLEPKPGDSVTGLLPTGFTSRFVHVNGIRLHYVKGGSGEAVVLLHGYPQNWYEWHRIMPHLAKHYTVIAPDLRGGGLSSKPVAGNGYSKKLLAEDIHQLVQKLGYRKIKLVGHDIGLMVAYAYAAQYPEEVDKLVVMDAPLPGIEPIWSLVNQDPRSEHFRTYQQRGYEQTLVGREREYLTEFFKRFAYQQQLPLTPQELDVFVASYSGEQALRGGFEWYRAFSTDVVDNQQFAQTKLPMPVLALGGEASSGPFIVELMTLVADSVTGGSVNGSIPQAGHWLVEEQPEIVLEELLAFFERPL